MRARAAGSSGSGTADESAAGSAHDDSRGSASVAPTALSTMSPSASSDMSCTSAATCPLARPRHVMRRSSSCADCTPRTWVASQASTRILVHEAVYSSSARTTWSKVLAALARPVPSSRWRSDCRVDGFHTPRSSASSPRHRPTVRRSCTPKPITLAIRIAAAAAPMTRPFGRSTRSSSRSTASIDGARASGMVERPRQMSRRTRRGRCTPLGIGCTTPACLAAESLRFLPAPAANGSWPHSAQ